MSTTNWIPKIAGVVDEITALALTHWEIAAVLAMLGAIAAIITAAKNEANSEKMRTKARILRYCHDCPWSDLFTESCLIGADDSERCGLIDGTSNIDFETPVKK